MQLLEGEADTVEVGRIAIAPIFSKIPLTITLKSGRREAMMSIKIIPSKEPIGWLETVMNAPSGRWSKTSALCRRYFN